MAVDRTESNTTGCHDVETEHSNGEAKNSR